MGTQTAQFTYDEFEKQFENDGYEGLYNYAKKYRLTCLYELYVGKYYDLYLVIKNNFPETDTTAIKNFGKVALKWVKKEYSDESNPAKPLAEGAQDFYDMWCIKNGVTKITAAAPSPDVESKMESGEPTTTLSEACVVFEKTTTSSDQNNSASSSASSTKENKSATGSVAAGVVSATAATVGVATAAVSGTVGIVGESVNFAAAGVGSAIQIAGVVTELTNYVISQSTSYITDAAAKIVAAGTTYTMKLPIDTAKKMKSYVSAMIAERMPSVSDFLTPVDTKADTEKEALKKSHNAEKLKKATEKINKAKENVETALSDVQEKISDVSVYMEEGPAKLSEFGTDIINTALSYVGNVRDSAIKSIAYWEEITSNQLAYEQAQQLSDEQLVTMEKKMKEQADKINKLKAKATIVSKKVTAVAISKVAALVGL